MHCIGDFSMKNKSLLKLRPKISASSVVRALLVHGLSAVAPAGGAVNVISTPALRKRVSASGLTHAAEGGSDTDDGIVNGTSVYSS